MKTETDTPPAPGDGSHRWRRRIKIAGIVLAICAVIFTVIAWRIGRGYAERAARIDLAALREAPAGTAVLDRHGESLGTLFDNNQGRVPLEDVPKHVVDALIATEDSRFYGHRGVDYRGVARAFVKNVTHLSVKQGGSTITQQLARQAFRLKGRTLDRKLLESFVARRIENSHTKQEILEFYLNRIYLGHGFYGMGAASRGYFGKPVQELTLEEGTLLVGIIKSPVPYSPFKNPEAARKTRDLTLKRMLQVGFIDAARHEAAVATPVRVLAEKDRLGRQNYVLAAVEQNLEELAKNGRGGPWKSVQVTVDGAMQANLDALVSRHVTELEQNMEPVDEDAGKLQAAAVIIDNHTGAVLATSGGRDFATSPFDRARQGQRPAGTAFLPLAHACIYSLKPDLAGSHVLDAPMDNRRVMVGGKEGQLGEWGAETSQPLYEGYLPAKSALLGGKTGATVRLAIEAGLEDVQDRLQQCGFTSPLQEYPGVVLGNSPIRLTDLARAYAALVSGGEIPSDTPLVHATTSDQGRNTPAPAPTGKTRFLSGQAADVVREVMIAALHKPVFKETLAQHDLASRGLAAWGGTAHGFTDSWFVGSDRHVTCAVWMGYDDPRRMKMKAGTKSNEASGNGSEAWSTRTTFPLWAGAMVVASKQQPLEGWPLSRSENSAPIPEPLPSAPLAALPAEINLEKEVVALPAPSGPEKPLSVAPLPPREAALIGGDPYQAFGSR